MGRHRRLDRCLQTDLATMTSAPAPRARKRARSLTDEVVNDLSARIRDGKYVPGQPLPEGSRATDQAGGARMIQRFMADDTLAAVQDLKPIAEDLGLSMPAWSLVWFIALGLFFLFAAFRTRRRGQR